MPTYDYRCNACKAEFEHFQSIKEKPLKKCPHCGKNTLERLIGTGGAILFKGSGFYQTDYRADSYKKAAEADKPRSDSKPDAKPSTETKTAPAKADAPAPKPENKPSKPTKKKPADA